MNHLHILVILTFEHLLRSCKVVKFEDGLLKGFLFIVYQLTSEDNFALCMEDLMCADCSSVTMCEHLRKMACTINVFKRI